MGGSNGEFPFPRIRLVAFSMLATLLFFGGAEVVCRTFYPSNCTSSARFEAYLGEIGSIEPASLEESMRRSIPMPYDPYLLWHLVLSYRGQNLGVEVVHNSRGLRSPEISLEKPANTVRVLLMGDSTVYGHGVQAEDMLRTRLELALQAALPGKTIQVINAGVPGYSSLQALNQLRRVTAPYQPDLVVVANMWSDCVHDTFEDVKVIYGEGWRGDLKRIQQWLDEGFAPRSALYCLFKARILGVAEENCEGLPPLCAPPMGKEKADDAQKKEEGFHHVKQPGSDGVTPTQPRVSPTDYEHNLLRIASLSRRLDAQPVFVQLANGVEMGEYQDADGSLGDYPAYRLIMKKVAKEVDAPWVDMTSAMLEARGISPDSLFMDRVHPSARGHAIMADALKKAMLKDERCLRALGSH